MININWLTCVMSVTVLGVILLKTNTSNKFWGHKVNTIAKLSSISSRYDGVELDVVFVDASGQFEVYHSSDKPLGLNLTEYVEYIAKNQSPIKVWLDVKNLNVENSSQVLRLLVETFTLYQFPLSNVTIESSEISLLEQFGTVGFEISYYLPVGLNQLKTDALMYEFTRVNKAIDAYGSLGLSSDIRNYKLIEKHFPTVKKRYWVLGKDYYKYYKYVLFAYYDKTVAVILITDWQYHFFER